MPPTDTYPHSDYTPWRATRFFIPLCIQAASQSLTYPLVAAIVSHGPNGVQDLAAFAQGHNLMFTISAFGNGLVTTGMVFARDLANAAVFRRLNTLFTTVLISAQALAGIPAISRVIFIQVIGLTPGMAETARLVMLTSIPMQLFFFLRNIPLVTLYNFRASGAANAATIARILLTAAFTPLFVRLGWVGWGWGVLAITLPIFLELALTQLFARPYNRQVPERKPEERITNLRTQFLFTIPITFGSFLLALSAFMIGAFISRSAEPLRMLPIHYITLGVINPVCYGALRMQAVVISFPSKEKWNWPVFRYACVAGAALALIPLVAQIPAVANWYFGSVQNLAPGDIGLAKQSILAAMALPFLQSIRGHAEGIAAWRRRPNAILAGQAVYLGVLMCALFIGLALKVPGNIIGVAAITIAVTFTIVTVRLGLSGADLEDTYGQPHRERATPED